MINSMLLLQNFRSHFFVIRIFSPLIEPFYEAGIMCRKVKWDEMSMMFLNRYLDVVDAIEEQNPEMLATSDFVETDIPYEIQLPNQPSLPAEQHEKIKEHVLAQSMKQAVRYTFT